MAEVELRQPFDFFSPLTSVWDVAVRKCFSIGPIFDTII